MRKTGLVLGVLLMAVIFGMYSVSASSITTNEKDKAKVVKEEKRIKKEKKKREKAEIKAKEKEGWKLTFVDNFDGSELDDKKWAHAPEWDRQGGAIQWSDEEAFLNGDGELVIQMSERDGKYYSGAVRTKDLFEQAYGYYEIRAKIPREEGTWSAFWLMSDSVHEIGNDGRDGTEIDIVESPYYWDDYIGHALHWDGYGEHHQVASSMAHVPGIYEGFHTFALEWNKDEYIFYIDGKETWRTSAGGVSQVPAYMKISAEAASWAGDITKANLPAQMIVDYVRVYEQKEK